MTHEKEFLARSMWPVRVSRQLFLLPALVILQESGEGEAGSLWFADNIKPHKEIHCDGITEKHILQLAYFGGCTEFIRLNARYSMLLYG